MKIRTIIIDDEPRAVDALALLLKSTCPEEIKIIATSNSSEKGKELISALSPDLVFLDIEMPGINGIDLIRSFVNPQFRVVFVTAFDAYALEAFRLSAIDYLLKPVDADEIVRVVQKIKSELNKNKNTLESRLNHLEELLLQNNPSAESRIGIFMAEKIVFVTINDIIYCEANGSYTNVYFFNGNKMVASKSLSEFELQLIGYKFFRIHRSYLINLSHVKEFQRHDGGYVIMENGKQLEVSQRKRNDFLAAIQKIAV